MSAEQQLKMTKDVYILSNERDSSQRRGQSYVGKLKYSCTRSFFHSVSTVSKARLCIGW